jgi:DNA polymerase-1
MKIPANPIVLVDGSSYLFRAYHALPALTNSTGRATGAIVGVINMLQKLVAEYKTDQIAVVFDCKEKTFRHEIYPEYKANRRKMPDDLAEQIAPIHMIIRAMGLPLIAISGVEADDVIGTIARQAQQQGMFTIISTGDKDFAQIVTDQIILVNTMTDCILDPNGVQEKFQVATSQIVDYLSLIGDSVDNIKGVASVGPKTAAKWLQIYGSLENIIANIEQITGKVGDNLRQELANLPLYKKLITIDTNVKLGINLTDLKLGKQNTEQLREIYAELELKKLLNNLPVAQLELPKAAKQYINILNKAALSELIIKLNACSYFALNTETTSLDYIDAKIVGISICLEAGTAYYIPIAHDYVAAVEQLPLVYVLDVLRPVLQGNNIAKILHNAKYVLSVFLNYGVKILGDVYDTMLESYVLNSTVIKHDLSSLVERYLHVTMIKYVDIAGKGAKQLGFNQVAIDVATDYSAENADLNLQLHSNLYPQIAAIPNLQKVLLELELPLIPVLVTMERNGVYIDRVKLQQQSAKLAEKIKLLENICFSEAGIEFNINSPKQLQSILFERLHIPMVKKTPTGQPSTAEPVLQELAKLYPLPKYVLEYRSVAKLKSTYTDKLPTQINASTGRVHTSYHQAITATGRLSSSEPNLQNIPIRSEDGRQIREAFIAEAGNKILSADYSQIELRIMAHLSNDANLIETFKQGKDVHIATAGEIFGIDTSKVSSDQRRHAKAINFGLIYGMSAYGLAKQLSIDKAQAQEFIDCYFKRFPKVKKFMEETREQATELGYVETMFGRRLYLPDLQSNNHLLKNAAERAAINAPMQGAQADIIKIAMLNVHKHLLDNPINCKMIMQVHDELVFELAENHVASFTSTLIEIMESAAKLSIPLVVDTGVGDNWGEAH